MTMAGAFQLMSPQTSTLGDALKQQVTGETDDERKKRMSLMQQNQVLGPAASLSVTSLLGTNNSGRSSTGSSLV
jgi:hypothetical protein